MNEHDSADWHAPPFPQPPASRPLPALASDPPVTDAATLATLDRVLAGDQRSAENKARDAWRHPKETLQFFGFRQDMTVLEVWPGGGGWYAEVLAPALREHGHYIAAGQDPKSESKYTQDNLKKFADKLAARPDLYDRAKVTALQAPNALEPVPDGSVDMVVTFRNVHNWMGSDSAEAMFKVDVRRAEAGRHPRSRGTPREEHRAPGPEGEVRLRAHGLPRSRSSRRPGSS